MKAEIGSLTFDKDEDGDVVLERYLKGGYPRTRVYLNPDEVLSLARWLVTTGYIKIEQNEFILL